MSNTIVIRVFVIGTALLIILAILEKDHHDKLMMQLAIIESRHDSLQIMTAKLKEMDNEHQTKI